MKQLALRNQMGAEASRNEDNDNNSNLPKKKHVVLYIAFLLGGGGV